MTTVHSFCRFCIAMCGVILEVDTAAGKVLEVRGDSDHPVSHGYLCPKGRSLGRHHSDPERLSEPLLGRPPQRRVATPEAVLDDLAANVAALLDTHGADSVGVMTGIGASFDSLATWATPRFLPRWAAAASIRPGRSTTLRNPPCTR